MSIVFSFRLDENNPREAQAMQVLQAWASKGYSLRYVVVEALLAYGAEENSPERFSSALDQIMILLQELRSQSHPAKIQENQDVDLSQSFVVAVAKSTRPGLRAESD